MNDVLNTIRPQLLTLSSEDIGALMPYFVVFGGTLLAILASVLRIISPKWPVFLITLVTLALGAFQALGLFGSDSRLLLFNHMMVSDAYSNFFIILFTGAAIVTTFSSLRYLDYEQLQHPEYYILLLFSTLGMMLMASSLNLIVTFIALELMSLSIYVLVGFRRTDRKSNEAAMKYFILGSVASAVLLYGSALLYGATGSLGIHEILAASAQMHTPVYALGAWLVILGFLFKVAAVPFHMWMPDVYEGAPAPITGFMTTGLKAAAFAAFIRVFISVAGTEKMVSDLLSQHMHNILWVCAVLTMLIGNVVALTQTNLKRMLAYSSIAHSGYLLVGMISGGISGEGFFPVIVYLVSYSIMNLGAFVILAVLASRGDGELNLHDLSGLSRRRPALAFAMAVFLFSMAGIPPTAGFAAKYFLFYSAVQAHETLLVIISVLCSAISVYYYLRAIVYMYMRDPVGERGCPRLSVWSTVAIAAMVILTLQLGMMPESIVLAAKKAVMNGLVW